MTTTTRPVVVGVDGLPGSAGALRYAATEAATRNAPLLLVHVVPSILSLGPPIPLADLEKVGREILDQAVTTVDSLAPGLEVSTMLVRGDRSVGIVQAAKQAQLVVVGRETRRGLDRLLTGTTTAAVAAHAHCDVVVVPSFWTADNVKGRVVVGVKSGANLHELLSQAFAEAASRHAALTVVTAWELADPYFDRIELRTHADEWERNGTDLVLEAAADWRTAYPDVPLEVKVVHGSPARILLEASESADVLVVSRRRFAFPPYGHLGGVGHSVLRLSDVPVHVVPYATEKDETEDAEDLVLEQAGAPLK
jgi:nucleotide-binding universal stress UspA family protein